MKIRKNCRICNNKLKKIVNFGKISLVGQFYKNKKKLKKFPLTLCYCLKCKHVQISESVNPKVLFENYAWETSVSDTSFKLFSSLVSDLRKKIKKQDKIFEIASNDGSFLNFLKKKYNCYLVGIDPAKNLTGKKKSFEIINSFFNYYESKKIKVKFGKFDFIFARNVLAHVTNPNEIFRGIYELLSSKGIAVIEVPHLLPIIKHNQYDNVFHEHQGFHSLKSINDLCKINNLDLFDVRIIDSQGGSLRCQIQKNKYFKKNNRILKIIKDEKKNKLFNDKHLISYKEKVKKHQKNLTNLLKNLIAKNKKISAYGASGKGQALMQFCKIDNKIIENIFDKSKLKNNRYSPSTNIKILNPEKIDNKKIDYILLLSWNLKKEILKQELKFLKKGGKFIVPFPKPGIIK